MAISMVEELLKQAVNAITGIEARVEEILQELPADRQEYWKNRFGEELNSFQTAVQPHTVK